jgi:hypothetical protein
MKINNRIKNVTLASLAIMGGLYGTNVFAEEVNPERQASDEIGDFDTFLDKETVFGGKFSTWIELASDYVFRGESETNSGKIPSLKGSITWTHNSGIYLGLYMANNLFPGGDSAQNNPDINAVYGPYIGYATKDIKETGINYNGFFISVHLSWI